MVLDFGDLTGTGMSPPLGVGKSNFLTETNFVDNETCLGVRFCPVLQAQLLVRIGQCSWDGGHPYSSSFDVQFCCALFSLPRFVVLRYLSKQAFFNNQKLSKWEQSSQMSQTSSIGFLFI